MTGDPGVVVAAVCRTPFGRFAGALKGMTSTELGACAIDALLARSDVPVAGIDAAYIGVGMIAAGVLTPARRMVLASRLPDATPSLTVDRACCSGMTAIGLAMRDLMGGDGEVAIAGGAEHLSSTPRLLPRTEPPKLGDIALDDPLLLRAPFDGTQIAVYSGQEALANGVDRLQQDEWALQSHERYFEAEGSGRFEFERVPLVAARRDGGIEITADESPRRDASLEKLGRLKTIYGGPTVTAGNAPGLNDGAAFLLLTTAERARRTGLPVLARILAYTQVAGDKTSGTWIPAVAIAKLLEKHGRQASSLDAIEINEAYAATPLVSTLKLADGDRGALARLRSITNVHGGAVAIGHPIGASGARIVMSLVNALRRRGGGTGAAAICGGYGQGDAVLVEVDR